MTTDPPPPTWFVHEDAVDDPTVPADAAFDLTPMDITVRAKAGEAGEIILCYMGPGLTGTIEEARAHARLIAELLNALEEPD